MFKKSIILIGLAIISANLCGCVAPLVLAGAAGGAGTAYWLSEKLVQDINYPLARVLKATHNALDSLNLPVTKETTTAKTTQIISKDKDNNTIWIDLKSTTEAATRIEVRVGVKGNKAAEHNIMEKISGYL